MCDNCDGRTHIHVPHVHPLPFTFVLRAQTVQKLFQRGPKKKHEEKPSAVETSRPNPLDIEDGGVGEEKNTGDDSVRDRLRAVVEKKVMRKLDDDTMDLKNLATTLGVALQETREECVKLMREHIEAELKQAQDSAEEKVAGLSEALRALSPNPEHEDDQAHKCLFLLVQVAVFSWACFDLNANVAKNLEGDWLCNVAFYTTMPMYKPVALAMWSALLPILAHVYFVGQAWETAPKKQPKGMNQMLSSGKMKPPLDSNWLTYTATAVMAAATAMWLVTASPFLALGFSVFLPMLVLLLFVSVVGIYAIRAVVSRGLQFFKEQTQRPVADDVSDEDKAAKDHSEDTAAEDEEAQLLRLKVLCAVVVSLAVGLTDFAVIYTSGRTGWAVIAGDALHNARRALRTDFSFGLAWPPPSFAWPALHRAADVQLSVSILMLALHPLLIGFGILYHKHGLGQWGASEKHARAIRWPQRFVRVVALGVAQAIDRALEPKGDIDEERKDITEWGPIFEYVRHTRATVLNLANCGFTGTFKFVRAPVPTQKADERKWEETSRKDQGSKRGMFLARSCVQGPSRRRSET